MTGRVGARPITALSGVSVTVSEATQVAPDLVVESESVSDSSVETGDTFTFSATVRNQGDGTAGSTTLHYHRSTDSAISSSDTEVGSDSVVSLGPNVPSPESIDLIGSVRVRARTTTAPAWTPCRESRARPTTARPV